MKTTKKTITKQLLEEPKREMAKDKTTGFYIQDLNEYKINNETLKHYELTVKGIKKPIYKTLLNVGKLLEIAVNDYGVYLYFNSMLRVKYKGDLKPDALIPLLGKNLVLIRPNYYTTKNEEQKVYILCDNIANLRECYEMNAEELAKLDKEQQAKAEQTRQEIRTRIISKVMEGGK